MTSPRTSRAFGVAVAAYGAVVAVWLVSGLVPAAIALSSGIERACAALASSGGVAATFAQTALDAASHGWSPLAALLDYVFSALNVSLAVLLVRRRPADTTARLLVVGMLGTACTFNLQSHALLDHIAALHELHLVLHHIVPGVVYVFALVVFPDGRLIPHWSAARLRVMYAAATVVTVYLAIRTIDVGTLGFVLLFGLLIPLVGVAAQMYRYRHATRDARQQSSLLLWGLTPALGAGLALAAVAVALSPAHPLATLDPWKGTVFRVLSPAFAVVPVALFVGILRYRLWDIDVVISKALQYAALAALIAGAYVLLVVRAVDEVAGPRTSLAASAALSAVLAIAFQPLRSVLERAANRLVYGARATPYEIMAGLARRLAAVPGVDDVLPGVAEAAARSVGAEHGLARLGAADSEDLAEASWAAAGHERGHLHPLRYAVPVTAGGEVIGTLEVRKRAGDALTRADARRLNAVAAQAGPAMRGVRLTAQLRAQLARLAAQADELRDSRRRLLGVRLEEARRLEREVRELVDTQLRKADEALARIGTPTDAPAPGEPAGAAALAFTRDGLLDQAARHVAGAIDALRELGRDTYPPLLADRGVGAALQAHARRARLPVGLDASGEDGRGDPHAEAAVYFCCVNILRHAARSDTPPLVRVVRDGEDIAFSVERLGAEPDLSDVRFLRDRVEALDGRLAVTSEEGTYSVAGRVPAYASVAVAGSSEV